MAAPPINSHVKAELISEVKSIQPGQPFWVAIRLTMDKDWHTYWRNPGDSGLPTKIAWQLPEGLDAGEIQWPYPDKFATPPVVSYGYEDEVLLLTKIEVSDSFKLNRKVALSAAVDWLECKEMCLPGHANLKIELPVMDEVPKLDERWAAQFENTRKRLPITIPDLKISAEQDGAFIIIQLTTPDGFKGRTSEISFFPQQAGVIDHSAVQQIENVKNRVRIKMKQSPFSVKPPARLRGVLYTEAGWQRPGSEPAIQIDVPLKQN
ncbi:MAG: protein-disulfide reductase DsbD domain-containing protein [bacterium]